MSPEGRLRLTYPLQLALAESPESLLEPETRLHHVEPVSLGGDLVEDAAKQAVLGESEGESAQNALGAIQTKDR